MGKGSTAPGDRIPSIALALGACVPYNDDYRRQCRRGQAKCRPLPKFRRTRVMATPRVLILRAPGANCDAEAEFAFRTAGAVAERVHINRLREKPDLLHRHQ